MEGFSTEVEFLNLKLSDVFVRNLIHQDKCLCSCRNNFPSYVSLIIYMPERIYTTFQNRKCNVHFRKICSWHISNLTCGNGFGIWYDIFNCNWLASRWQQYSTHLHTNNTQNDAKQIISRTTQKFWKSAGRAPSFRVLPWNLPYNWEKSADKPQ
jgi:hypothetical protein